MKKTKKLTTLDLIKETNEQRIARINNGFSTHTRVVESKKKYNRKKLKKFEKTLDID